MTRPDEPIYALSIQQPWAGLIAAGLKDIENRSWRTNFRGPFLIHAGKTIDRDAMDDIASDRHPVMGGSAFVSRRFPDLDLRRAFWDRLQLRGGIVGRAEIGGCSRDCGSDWYVGPWGFRIRNAEVTDFTPLKGALGFFKVPPGLVARP